MPQDRRFRFGCIVRDTKSAKDFTELARRVEASGFSTLFVPDHFIDHQLAPTVALAHAAAVTDTLRVGPLVLGNDYKHPVVLAREAATLDLLSDGRLELGIGAGWMTADYEKAGMPLDRPGVRIARLAESITILKGLFADGAFSFTGEHYTVTDLDGQPKPVQQPHPPFIVGGGGPKILALAATEAQIVGINANLRSGDGTSPDAAHSLTSAATDAEARIAAGGGGRPVRRPRDPNPGRVRARRRRRVGHRRCDGDIVRCRSRGCTHGAGHAGRRRSRASSTCSKRGANAGRCRTSCCPMTRSTSARRSSPGSPEPERLSRQTNRKETSVAHDRKFRFGVQISPDRHRRTSGATEARKIEDLGFSTLFMPDHFDQELAPLPAMAMAAAHTTTLRIGSLVFDNDYKHPAILAKEAATIDLLSDGRYELGIGAGWMKTDYDKLGIPYDPPAVRVDRFEEAIQVIKGCFAGEPFSVSR